MNVQQLSVSIENKAGRVSQVTDLLGDAGVNITGFSVADTAGQGVLRLIVDDPDRAARLLSDRGFAVEASDVVCVRLEDAPGGLARALKVVSDAGVTIEYIYSLVSTCVVLNVTDPDKAVELLAGQPVQLVSQEEISAM
jgi:hypothetical protein